VRIPRTRGALTGLLLVILGLWGGLIPFLGPYFNYAIGPNHAWTWKTGRLWLDILPAAAVFFGGLILIASATRPRAHLGGWLALIGGLWFVVGPVLSMLWNHGVPQTGVAFGGDARRTVEWIGYYYGLGAACTMLASFALGRLSIVSVRDAELAGRRHPVATGVAAGAGAEYTAHRERKRERRFRRGRAADEPAPTTSTAAGDRTASPRD
jgi:hypothetical protein